MTRHADQPTPEAVEAAARALAAHDGLLDWDRVFSQSFYLDAARAALSAALPLLTVKPARSTIARAITEQLAFHTLPTNVSTFAGGQTVREVARRSGPLIADAVLTLLPGRTEAQVEAAALRTFARRWGAWLADDAPQIRGGAAYRANAEADRIERGEV